MEKAGLVAAGYLQISAHGRSIIDPTHENVRYYPYTKAQYSVTVRDSNGGASGWAGRDHYDWTRIDMEQLSTIALEKCLAMRNPVGVEPGRWTVILEPQAVCDFTASAFSSSALYRPFNESGKPWVYSEGKSVSHIGQRVFDPRITVTMDCMDPDLGSVPFTSGGTPLLPMTWVDQGVLSALAYNQPYAVRKLGLPDGRPSDGSFRMSGETTTIEDMIATTKRGLRITRFSNVQIIDRPSLLSVGYTRDGIWLIENGKITKPVKNFRFTESPMFALNNVEQLGVPQRVFRPSAPVVVPPLKIRDFNLSSLADAV